LFWIDVDAVTADVSYTSNEIHKGIFECDVALWRVFETAATLHLSRKTSATLKERHST
jgi:hypothetical protein